MIRPPRGRLAAELSYPDELKEYRLVCSAPTPPAKPVALRRVSDEAKATCWALLDAFVDEARR